MTGRKYLLALIVILSVIVDGVHLASLTAPAGSKLGPPDREQLQVGASSVDRLIGEPESGAGEEDSSDEEDNEPEQMGEGSSPFGTEVDGANHMRLSREDNEGTVSEDEELETNQRRDQVNLRGDRLAQLADGAGELLWSEPGEQDELPSEPHGLDSNIENAKIQLTDIDQVPAAGHHHHHHHYVHGKLDMGAHTGKKGSFGWHDKHPVGGKGRR